MKHLIKEEADFVRRYGHYAIGRQIEDVVDNAYPKICREGQNLPYAEVYADYRQFVQSRQSDNLKRMKGRTHMPSKPQIESWLPDAIAAFNQLFQASNVSYFIVTKSKETSTIKELKTKLGVPHPNYNLGQDWAGVTLPGHKGTAIIIRQYGLRGKTDFKRYLWHEMGHAFAFANESDSNFWANPSPAYMVWAEFVADMIAFSVIRAQHNTLHLYPSKQLQLAFGGEKIEPGAIGHLCSETQFIDCPENMPKPVKAIREMFHLKMQEEEFWKIDQQWLQQIMDQLNMLIKH